MPKTLRQEEARIAIRDMQERDIPAIAELAARVWREHYPGIISREQIEYMLPGACSEASIKAFVRDKQQRFWLAYAGQTLAGYAAVQPKENGVWFIDKLYIDAARHRLGLGSALLAHIIAAVRPRALTLRVNRRNVKAINFYFKHGFAIEGLDVLDIGGSYVMDDFLMRRTV